MAIVVSPPEKVGFSKDDNVWRFEDDRAGIVPGIPAESIFAIGNAVLPGAQVVFRWGENELRFTAVDGTPGPYGSEFPAYPVYDQTTHEAYVKSLVPFFKNNFFLQQDFLIEADSETLSGPFGSTTIWYIKFTALLAGSQFNFNKTVFAGGGITPTVTGTDDSTIVNNSVYVEVWMENGESSIFQKKYAAMQPFGADSIAEFNVSAVLHSSMASEIPDMVLPVAERCNQSRKKYYLRYALAGGTNLSIGPIEQTEDFVVLLGGFAQWKSGPQSVVDTFKLTETKYKLLMLRSPLRVVRMDESVFVSWVNFGAAGRNIHARATVKFADNTEQTTNTAVISNVLQYEKLIFGVGFKQLNLGYFNSVGKTVKEFTIELRDDLGAVSDPYRLVVNYAHQEYVRYFAHINSYGSVETLMTYGKGSSNWKVFKEQAEQLLPYSFQSTAAQFVDWNVSYQDNQEVATGWMRKKELKMWLDLFISSLKYRVINGVCYAIQINSDTIQRGTDGENQHGLTFEYQFARIFDSLSEETLEGEDSLDFIPPNVVLAGSLPSGSTGGVSGPPVLRIDPYPIAGSQNAVSSDGMHKALQQFQKKLPVGLPTDYYNGEGKLRNLKQAVNAAETDPTVPSYAKSLTGFDKIFNQLLPVLKPAVNAREIDPTVPDFAKSLESIEVIFDALQALNPGLDVALFGGQFASWYIERMTHPKFDEIPPIVVEKGKPFDKFIDLSLYKTSYHQLTDLTVDLKYNGLFLEGVELTKDGLVIRVTGEIPKVFGAETRLIIAVKDQHGNTTPLGIQISSLQETEEPDDRPLCGKGPFHYMATAIQVFNNGSIRVPFDADGVPQLRWKIVNNESDLEALREGISQNDNGPFFKAEFEILPGKTYKLGIQGDLCKSPWVFRDLVLPVDNTLNWAPGYPKYEAGGSSSAFLAKVDLTGQYLTELVNTSNNTTVYSTKHDYIANVTVIPITKQGGWPDGNYRLSVGALSEMIKVGNPIEPPSHQFRMVAGYDGALIKDLATGPYKGGNPASGFNVVFSSSNLGFQFTSYSWKHYVEVNGVYQHVTSVGGEAFVGSGYSTFLVGALRIFPLNVDSRLVQWNGRSLNQTPKQKTVVEFKNGANVVGSFSQTIEMNELKIYGGWYGRKNAQGRVVPVVGDVRYNGVQVANNGSWNPAYPANEQGARRIEYSFDKNTWYGTSPWFDNEDGNTYKSNLILANEAPGQAADQFPPGTNKTIYLRNGFDTSVVSEGYQINQAGAVALLGTFEATVNGRRITFQKSPGLELTLNADGTITDTTPGTVHGTNGGLTTCNGRNVFYMIGYNYLCGNGDGVRIYKTLKNLKLRDSIETVSRFDCVPGALPTWQAMQDGFGGYPIATGVNKFNAEMSQVTFSLHTLSNPGIPLWLVPSRKLNCVNYIPDRTMSRKFLAIERVNRGDAPSIYWAKGIRTQTQFDNSVSQRLTFRTFKWPWDLHPGMPVFTDSDLFNSLRGHINAWDLGPESVITDEYPENAQNQDPNIGSRVGLAYKGGHELMVEKFPGYRKIDGPFFGSYGGHRFYGAIDTTFLYKHPKAVVAEYLSTKVHKAYNVQTASFTADDCAFYLSEQYKWCNINVDYYMYFGVAHYNIALDLVFINERIKIGSILKGDECSWMVFGTILSQSLMRNDQQQQIGPEEYRTGDLMQFPNGVVLSKYNTPIAANVSEHWNMGFWSAYIGGRGTALWDGGGSYGQDPTKISTYTPADQYIRWYPNSGGSEPYISGQNGAPENSVEGMSDVLYATVVDATVAGHQAALDLEGYDDIKYFASYTSSRKTFVATPGEKGFQLSGNGVANIGLLAMKDVADQKCGTPIISQGPKGRLAVYNNGFLSRDEFEENVTLTYGAWSVNLGTIYGGQTKWVKF